MKHTTNALDVYRISKGADRWGRRWQAEYDDGRCAWMWCPRAWTAAGARRKALRWLRTGTDIRRHERRYGRNNEARRMRVQWLADGGMDRAEAHV